MATLTAPVIDDLITDVRNMLGQPSAQNSVWGDEELMLYLNEGVRRYFAEVALHAEGQFVPAPADLNIVTGVETVALPSDFFRVEKLWRKVSDGYVICSYRNPKDEGYSTNDGGSGSGYVPEYYIRGANLVLRPTPNFSETAGLKLEYTAFPEVMAANGDTLTAQVATVFRDLIVMYGVYKAKVKESLANGVDMTPVAKDNLNDLYTAFKDLISKRSSNPTSIVPFNPEE